MNFSKYFLNKLVKRKKDFYFVSLNKDNAHASTNYYIQTGDSLVCISEESYIVGARGAV